MPEHAHPALTLRPLTEDDLELVRAWRNHPAVRDYMYNTHEIGAEEHRQWFQASRGDATRELLLYAEDGIATGYVAFQRTRVASVAEWGFYTAPGAAPGTGRRLGRAALDHAFGPLGLHKVCGEALAFNSASLRFHDALGFTREGVLREQHFDGVRYHDVIRFGLLAREWPSSS